MTATRSTRISSSTSINFNSSFREHNPSKSRQNSKTFELLEEMICLRFSGSPKVPRIRSVDSKFTSAAGTTKNLALGRGLAARWSPLDATLTTSALSAQSDLRLFVRQRKGLKLSWYLVPLSVNGPDGTYRNVPCDRSIGH